MDSTSLCPYLEVSLSRTKDQGHSHSPLPVPILSLLQSQSIPSYSKRRIQSYLESSAATAIDVMWCSLLMLRGFSVDPCLLLLLAAHHCPAHTPFSLCWDYCPPVPTLSLLLMGPWYTAIAAGSFPHPSTMFLNSYVLLRSLSVLHIKWGTAVPAAQGLRELRRMASV